MLLGLLVCGIVAAFHLWIFSWSPYVYGVDGPYYLIQIESLLQESRLKYPDPPLTFLVFLAASLVFGDPTLGIKVVMSLTGGLLALVSYLLASRLTSGWKAGLIAAILVGVSPYMVRLEGDFMKNALGLLFLAILILGFETLTHRYSRGWLALTVVAGLLLPLTHVLPLAMGIIYLAVRLPTLPRRDAERGLIFLLLLIAVALLSAHLLGYFGDIMKGFYVVESVGETGVEGPRKTPVLFDPAYLGVAVGGVVAAFRWRRTRGFWGSLLAFSILLLALSLPIYPHGYQNRFMYVCFLPSSLTLAMLFAELRLSPGLIALVIILLASSAANYGHVIDMVMPKIDENGIRELETVSKILPRDAVVAVRVRKPIFYWVAYIVGERIALKRTELRPTHVIIEKGVPPPPGARPIWVGRRFALYELRRPPPPP